MDRKDKDKLDTLQMTCLMIAYTTGSSIVFIPNSISEVAHSTSWLSMLISFSYGVLVLICVLYLHRTHNGVSLIEYSRSLIGNVMTYFLSLPLILMLFFSLPGVVAGIGEFLSSVMMTETPGYVFNSLILLIAAFTVRSGVKVMARMFVLLVGIMLALTLLVLLMAIPNYDPLFLFPFFSDGIRPVLHGAFISAGFPFGEIFLFSMVFPFVRGNGKMASVKSMYLAYGLSGSVLLLSVVCNLMAFGPATGTLKYSLYSLASVIQIADFIQRIEAIVVIALITGSYMKACIFLFILNQIMVKLLRLKDENTLVYPISLVSLMLSLTMFRTPAEFTKQVYTLWPFTVIFIGSAILFLLVIMSLFKQKNRASSAKG